MTTATLTPATSTSTSTTSTVLSERAMLIDLTIRRWRATKSDKTVNRKVAEDHGSDEKMGNYRKRLLAKAALDELQALSSTILDEHHRRTVPWVEKGARLLSSAGYFDYAEAMRSLGARWDTSVAKFLAAYPAEREAARLLLGKLFNEADYPAPDRIAELFDVSYRVMPVPSGATFWVAELTTEEMARLRKQVEADTEAALHAAMTDVYERVKEVVGRMAERLRSYTPATNEDPSKGVFRDSLVENVRDLVGLLPSLNLTQDAALAALTEQMQRELTAYDAPTLRANPVAREQVAAAAEKIMAQMADFI